MDAIAYTIYDVCSRTNRALDVMNKKKKTFRFMLGKMSDYLPPKDYTQEELKEIRVKLQNLCIIKYTEKEILNKHI